MTNTAARRPERVLNVGPGPPEDGKKRRSDLCPKCGAERWELLVVPDRFFCDRCQVASLGPNEDVAEPELEQIDLFESAFATPTSSGENYEIDLGPSNEIAKSELAADEPPIDEGMAWIAEEMPDE